MLAADMRVQTGLISITFTSLWHVAIKQLDHSMTFTLL